MQRGLRFAAIVALVSSHQLAALLVSHVALRRCTALQIPARQLLSQVETTPQEATRMRLKRTRLNVPQATRVSMV